MRKLKLNPNIWTEAKAIVRSRYPYKKGSSFTKLSTVVYHLIKEGDTGSIVGFEIGDILKARTAISRRSGLSKLSKKKRDIGNA